MPPTESEVRTQTWWLISEVRQNSQGESGRQGLKIQEPGQEAQKSKWLSQHHLSW